MADLTKEEKAKLQQNKKEENDFNSKLHEIIKYGTKINKPLTIGITPNVLTICGANPNLDFTISKKVIDKCLRPEIRDANGKLVGKTGHGLTEQQLVKTLADVRNPIMVLKGNQPSSFVVVSDTIDNQNRQVLVSIALNKQGNQAEINDVTSAYGRQDFAEYIEQQIIKDKIVALHKEKGDKLCQSIGKKYPEPNKLITFNDSIAYTLKNVKYPEKNLIEQANVSQKSEVISDLNFAEVFEPETSTNDAILHEKAEVFYDLSDMGTTANNIDYKKVFELYSESAKADDATALNNLGCCYINGEGTDRSIQKAIECFERAAALKNSLAVVNLGKCAAVGCGVAKDPERAFELYRQAANMGSPLAYRMLAECYLNGVGTNKDVSKAADCLRQAETVKNKPLSLEEKLLQAERKANAANENNKQQRKEKSQNVSKSI